MTLLTCSPRYLVILAIVLFIIPVAACAKATTVSPNPVLTNTPESPFIVYTDEEYGFRISYPENWAIDEESCHGCGGLLAVFNALQPCSNMTSFFEVKRYELTTPVSINECFDLMKAYVFSEFEDYTPIADEELQVDSKPSIKHIYTYNSDQEMYTIALIILDDLIVWHLYCTCAESCPSECEAVFDTMAVSFNLIE